VPCPVGTCWYNFHPPTPTPSPQIPQLKNLSELYIVQLTWISLSGVVNVEFYYIAVQFLTK